MDVSLVICTRDRCRQLVDCLASLRQISFGRPWEIILVDNGSVDNTKPVIEDFIRTASISVMYLFEPNRGKSNALNAALAVAKGSILAFTDDDCYPAPDFLTCVWSAFEDPSVGYITGRLLLHDPADFPVTIKESPIPRSFPARSFVPVGAMAGANMAFRRQVLVQIGGFDPLLGPGSPLEAAEDLDVAGRASAIGWRGQYRPEMVVRHHHRRKASDAPRLWSSYGTGAGAYHIKLLLRGGEFLWFIRSLGQIRRRYKINSRLALWEPFGAIMYATLYLRQAFRVKYARKR